MYCTWSVKVGRTKNPLSINDRSNVHQEACGDAESTLTAAEEAVERVPRSGRLRARLLAALRAARPLHECLERLRDMLAKGN